MFSYTIKYIYFKFDFIKDRFRFMSQLPKISPQLKQNLNRLVKYDSRTFVNQVLTRLKDPLEKQTTKIQQAHASQMRKDFNDQQLLILVLNNHIKAIVDLKTSDGTFIQSHTQQHHHTVIQSNIEQYEKIIRQFSDTSEEINRIVVVNNNFSDALKAIEKMINRYNGQTYDASVAELVSSRTKLLGVLYTVLKNHATQAPVINGNSKNLPEPAQLKKGVFSFKDLEQNDVHLIIEELDEKVAELSTICQQIPQLETFKRTLDLTMPEHNVNFTRIVDVLIELHHKVNQLISRRPQKLLKQIEAVEKQCLLIERTTGDFISKLQSEQEMQIKVIYFDQKKNKSPEYFRRIQKNIVKISEHMIYCLNMESQYQDKMIDIRNLIELFFKIVSNLEENYENQWNNFRKKDELSEEEQKIIEILDQCIRVVEENREQLIRIKEEYEAKIEEMRLDASNSVGYLQQDVNKMNAQNQELKSMIDEYQKERIQLKEQINELKKKNLETLSQYKNQIASLEQSAHQLQAENTLLKDKIRNLQAKNNEQENIISNLKIQVSSTVISNNIPNNSNPDNLQSEIARINREWEARLSEIQQDYTIRINSKQAQITKNKQTITSLNAQLARLKSELDVANAKIPSKEDSIQITEEVKIQIIEKDKTINELNNRLSDLNSKMADMLNKYKSMQYKVEEMKKNEIQLQKQIVIVQNAEKNKIDLENAFKEIEKCRSIVVGLQNQLNRRDATIVELKERIQILDKKIESLLQQNGNLQYKCQSEYQRGFRDGQQQGGSGQKNNLIQTIKELQYRIQDLQNQIKRKDQQITDLRNQPQQANLQAQISNLKNELNRKDGEILRLNNQVKITGELRIVNEKNQAQIRNLRSSLDQENRNSSRITQELNSLKQKLAERQNKIRELENLLSLKNNQLKNIQIEINSIKNVPVQNTKEIEYLKQKIRSLEELIEIFTEEHAILEAKIKQYRLKQGKFIEQLNKAQQDSYELKKILQERDSQLREIRNSRFTINGNNNMFDESAKKNEERIHQIQSQLFTMNNRLSESHLRFEDQSKNWSQKEKSYIIEIEHLRSEINHLKRPISEPQAQDKYYLRVQGQKLEQFIIRMETGSELISSKVDELLTNSRSRINARDSQIPENQHIIKLTQQNRLLIEEVRKLMHEKTEAAEILRKYPNPDFLTEFIFRVIIFFAELHPESSQGKAVWEQLANIRNSYEGSQYFVVLQDFTKFYLQENTIQIYRRKLKEKADELQILKQRLDKFLEEKIKSQQNVYNTTILSQSRARLFRQRYLNTSRVQGEIQSR